VRAREDACAMSSATSGALRASNGRASSCIVNPYVWLSSAMNARATVAVSKPALLSTPTTESR
jgi:hypothetical protein